MSQLRRLQNALAQNSSEPSVKEKHIADTLSRQLKQFNKDYTSFEEGNIEIYVDEKLTHRNHKKEEAKLYKHAMHLVRILITGTYILEGKGIHTRLEEHLPTLLSMRHGEYSWDKVFKIVDIYEKQFNKVAGLTKLPSNPKQEEIQRLVNDIYEGYYSGTGHN